jgi:hypothetical protein
VPDAAVMDFGGDFTLSAWIKTATAGPMGAPGARIISKRSGGNIGYELYIVNSGTYPDLFVGDSSGYFYPAATVNVSDANWHYVVGERAGGNILIYVDGLLVGSFANVRTGSVSSTISLSMGQFSSTSFFPGLIDDVRIYNRALSAAEISAMYSGSK